MIICWTFHSNHSSFDIKDLTSYTNLGGKVSGKGLLSWWCGGTWLNRHYGLGLDPCSSHAHLQERSPSGMWNFIIPDILHVSSLYSCNDLWVMIGSPISTFCHLGVMILGLAFFKDSVPQRYGWWVIWFFIFFGPYGLLEQIAIWTCNWVTGRRWRGEEVSS